MFQCSSASRKFLTGDNPGFAVEVKAFQCSSASRKFLTVTGATQMPVARRFSALQRAENSSQIHCAAATSASIGFSALQRAENSSPETRLPQSRSLRVSVLFSEPKIPHRLRCWRWRRTREFQCSSASRKFLTDSRRCARDGGGSFSALQRAENSSLKSENRWGFAEIGFSALQRAENSSPFDVPPAPVTPRGFSALQRAENSSHIGDANRPPPDRVSVLFSEPKIPHSLPDPRASARLRFQCSSASRKFLTSPICAANAATGCFSALQRAENSSPNRNG